MVFSAEISHPNGKRLFGKELHIGPTSLNPPSEYQSLPCFVSFSSITRSSSIPCEMKLAWKYLPLPTVSPIILHLSFFCKGQSIFWLAKGNLNLLVRARTSNFQVELWVVTCWSPHLYLYPPFLCLTACSVSCVYCLFVDCAFFLGQCCSSFFKSTMFICKKISERETMFLELCLVFELSVCPTHRHHSSDWMTWEKKQQCLK